jgi:hypothetical protein
VSLRAGLGRGEAVAAIVDAIDAVSCSHPVRVAIDGSAAAGKTMLADELAISLRGRGRNVIRASIEGFLRPRIERYRRGPESAQGCYEDSFDYDRLRVELLRPLGESGSRLYRTEIYDRRTDLLVDSEQMEASADAILLFDGVFLLRPELVDAWELKAAWGASPGPVCANVTRGDLRFVSRATARPRLNRYRFPKPSSRSSRSACLTVRRPSDCSSSQR